MLRRQRISAEVWDRSRRCGERFCPVRCPPTSLCKRGFGIWQRIEYRDLHFHTIQVRSFRVVYIIHLPNIFEKSLLSDCPMVTTLSQMQMLIVPNNYAFLNVRPVESSCLDDLVLLWNKVLDWLMAQTIYSRLYVIQLTSLCSYYYGSYSFNCGHCCWIILWVWMCGFKINWPHIFVVIYLDTRCGLMPLATGFTCLSTI